MVILKSERHYIFGILTIWVPNTITHMYLWLRVGDKIIQPLKDHRIDQMYTDTQDHDLVKADYLHPFVD